MTNKLLQECVDLIKAGYSVIELRNIYGGSESTLRNRIVRFCGGKKINEIRGFKWVGKQKRKDTDKTRLHKYPPVKGCYSNEQNWSAERIFKVKLDVIKTQ